MKAKSGGASRTQLTGKRPDVAIIGAGAAGLSTAFHALRFGAASVVVLEQEQPASGATGLTVGNVGTCYANKKDVEIRASSLRTFEALGDEIGYVETGVLRLARADEPLGRFHSSAAYQQECGVEAEFLDAERLHDLVPDLQCDDLAGGVYSPRGGHVDGHLLCQAYLTRIRDAGASVRTKTRVLSIDRRAGRYVLSTSKDVVTCDVIVNAAGPWATQVAAMADLELNMVPQRHEVYIGRLKGDRALPQIGDYLIDRNATVGDGLYIRPEGVGRAVMGVHLGYETELEPANPDDFAAGISQAGTELVAARISHRLPGLAGLTIEGGWAGLYPTSPDDQPQIGPWADDPSFIAVTGLGGFGVQISPVVGEIAAEWAVRGSVDCIEWAAELLPDRRTHAGVPA